MHVHADHRDYDPCCNPNQNLHVTPKTDASKSELACLQRNALGYDGKILPFPG